MLIAPIIRWVVSPALIQSSPFASSSRFRLDFTSPRLASPPRANTTLLDPSTLKVRDRPPTEDQAASQTGETVPFHPPSTIRVRETTDEPKSRHSTSTLRLSQTPLFNLNTTHAQSQTQSSRKTRKKGEPKVLRYAPEDSSSDHSALTHTLTITSSRNNVLLTFTDAQGPVFGTITGGTGGIFRKSNRNSYEAAHQACLKMITRIIEYSRDVPRVRMRVAFKGMFGTGRDAVATALGGNEGGEIRTLVGRVEDRTPYVITGTRARSPRRV